MSKASDLRRKATEAVRAKDFDRAVELYEKVCAQDPSNGTPRNELGDVFLKLGDTERAVASFTEAARLYHEFGLTNNAVAVHKKILRHEPNHLHSLWVLGDIRRDQGLEAEASAAFLEFLNRFESVTESEREAFVSRGLQLIELMGDDPQILSVLDSIFAQWDFGQERARVLIAKARLAHDEGEFEVREKYVEHARSVFAHLEALPDYVDFRAYVDPQPEEPAVADDDSDDDGTVVIDDETDFSFADVDVPVFDAPKSESFDEGGSPSTRVTLDSTDIDLGFDFDMDALDGAGSGGAVPTGVADSTAVDPVPEFEVDDDDDSSSYEIADEPADEPADEVSEATDAPAGESSGDSGAWSPEPGIVLGAEDPMAEDADGFDAPDEDTREVVAEADAEADAEAGAEAEADVASEDDAEPVVSEAAADEPSAAGDDAPDAQGSVDLLEQILSDSAFDMQEAERSQMDTIASEMRGQIGSDVDPDDYAGQYEVGMVYMDMALYEQAIEAFDLASKGDDERLRALEMKGTCLLRLDRVEDALAVFHDGLAVPGYPGRSYMGLLYGVGAGNEARGDHGAALEYFERVHAVDTAFLDVDERIRHLRTLVGES